MNPRHHPDRQTRCDAALCLIHAGGAVAFAMEGQPAHAIVAAGAALVYGMLAQAGFTASALSRRPSDADASISQSDEAPAPVDGAECEATPDQR